MGFVMVECGTGEQILRWLAYTACSRLAYLKGDVPQMYVPQSVLSMEGMILDVDTVINELYVDGDGLYVEYSSGPEAFKSRWEGRPNTPPFQWGEEGIVGPSDHEWLEELDLKAYGVDKLVNEDLVAQNPAALEQDLHATKEVLKQYAGGLQAIFKYYESQGDIDARDLDRMNLSQFRSLFLDSRVTTDSFKSAMIDENFQKTLDALQAANLTSKKHEHAYVINLQEFMIGLIYVANAKYAMGLEGPGHGYSELSVKLTHVLTDFVFANVAPGITERLKSLEAAITPNSQLLLKKGRRLTEQTLDSCQLRRVASAERRLDVKYLTTHLKKWELVDKHIDLNTCMQLLLFAKHQEYEVTKMELKKHPLEVNYDEFERLLLAIAYHMYKAQQRDEPFEEYLGEMLDDIYKKAGVLVEIRK